MLGEEKINLAVPTGSQAGKAILSTYFLGARINGNLFYSQITLVCGQGARVTLFGAKPEVFGLYTQCLQVTRYRKAIKYKIAKEVNNSHGREL